MPKPIFTNMNEQKNESKRDSKMYRARETDDVVRHREVRRRQNQLHAELDIVVLVSSYFQKERKIDRYRILTSCTRQLITRRR